MNFDGLGGGGHFVRLVRGGSGLYGNASKLESRSSRCILVSISYFFTISGVVRV